MAARRQFGMPGAARAASSNHGDRTMLCVMISGSALAPGGILSQGPLSGGVGEAELACL